MRSTRQARLADAEQAFQAILLEDAGNFDALHRIGAIRTAQGRCEEALDYLQRALERDPDSAAARYNLGIALGALKRTDEAIASYRKAIELDPALPEAHCNLGTLLDATGLHDEGVAAYRRALAIKPDLTEANHNLMRLLHRMRRRGELVEHYRQWLAAGADSDEPTYVYGLLTGAVAPRRVPGVLIEREFDRDAENYDTHAQAAGNRAPRLIARALRWASGAPQASDDILDAGCGTGRCGVWVKPHARRLTGVDLSARMLERAQTTGLYDELVHAELSGWLTERVDAFDAIVAADVFSYFGPLDALLAAAHGALRAGGLLVFTAERVLDYRAADGYRSIRSADTANAFLPTARSRRGGFRGAGDRAGYASHGVRGPVAGFIVTSEKIAGPEWALAHGFGPTRCACGSARGDQPAAPGQSLRRCRSR